MMNSLKFGTLGALIAFGFAALSPAFANDTMDAMIGNTVTYTYEDGTAINAYYNDDGTYTTDGAGDGTYTIDGSELCITTSGGQSGCTTLDDGKTVGDSWDGTDAFGNAVTISIS